MNYLKEISKDLLWIGLSVAGFVLAPQLILLLDPTAGTTDLGVLQLLLLAATRIFAGWALTWATIKLGFRTVHLYIASHTESDGTKVGSGFLRDWNLLPPWGRILATLACVFFAAFFALVCIATL